MTSPDAPGTRPADGGNVLTTPRLTLREVRPDEIGPLLRGRPTADARWAEGYPSEGTLGGLVLVSRMLLVDAYRPGFGLYQIVVRDGGETVGDICFHSAPDENGSVEIGYGLVEAYRGRGIATEATRALTAWALDRPDVTEVRAETDPGHLPSQRVLLKSGFRDAGTHDGMHRFVLRHAPTGAVPRSA
ncbi:GNAT family N-acetyltransferase [Streptomyces macrosporus]|uniref:GNAT family N-acetyltransferase n=1 Tax=Streptomyces macrosporus TaxID=44032 RepID=A0ABP5WQX6_9ACTN